MKKLLLLSLIFTSCVTNFSWAQPEPLVNSSVKLFALYFAIGCITTTTLNCIVPHGASLTIGDPAAGPANCYKGSMIPGCVAALACTFAHKRDRNRSSIFETSAKIIGSIAGIVTSYYLTRTLTILLNPTVSR